MQPPSSRLVRNLGRIAEVVSTDLLVREVARPVPPRRARIPLAVHSLTAVGQADMVPHDRRSRVRTFLSRGDEGFVGSVGDQFAGWVWLSRVSHRDPYSGLRIRLAPDEAYAYALWVAPEVRPHGVAAVLMTAMLSAVGDDPALSRVYGWVDQRNRESQMLLRLLGFERMQAVRRLHLLHRFGRAVPGSDRPPFGPLSRHGRHNRADM